MPRINVFEYPTEDHPQLVGWFDPDSATRYHEDTSWDGSNHISVNVGRHNHQSLYRTKGGRWVLNDWSDWVSSEETFRFVSDEVAKEWLLRNKEDAAAEEWFGQLEEEAGPPNLGGRPPEGKKVETRLADDVLAALDERAATESVPRAEMIRRLVTAGLGL